jgi:hypothetical protein
MVVDMARRRFSPQLYASPDSGSGAGDAGRSDAGSGETDPSGRRVVPGADRGVPTPPPGSGAGTPPVRDEDEPELSHPDELETVMPEGAEASKSLRGAVGDRPGGGVGSGTGPGSDPPVGGLQQ